MMHHHASQHSVKICIVEMVCIVENHNHLFIYVMQLACINTYWVPMCTTHTVKIYRDYAGHVISFYHGMLVRSYDVPNSSRLHRPIHVICYKVTKI